MNHKQIAAAARTLHQAEAQGVQIRSISLDHPDMTLADAYAVQEAWVALKRSEGRRVRGRKIGLTSKAMQQAMQIDTPDYGTLLDDMLFEHGARIEAARYTDPRVEVEVAFVLGERLFGEGVSLADVLAATDHVRPAVELIAARTHRVDPETQRPRGVLDTISDNAAAAGVILGDQKVDPRDVDLRWIAALLIKNGEVEESGVAAAVLNHPANGVAWLARSFAAHGIALEPGELILAGSFTRPVAVAPGDLIDVDYGAFGRVTCSFV